MANDTINDPRLEEGVWTTDPESGELVPDYESTFPTIEEGQVVNGTVVRVDKDEVLVDIGYKSEGVIPVSELSIRRSINPEDEVSVGDDIAALVLTKEDAEGRLILSKKRARFEIAWKAIEGAHEKGEPVTGRVIEVVKGGLILDLGVRGFLPASLVDIRRVQDLDEFLGHELECKVIELNRSRNNVVLSRRAVLEEERKEQRQRILDRLNPTDVVEGTISNIVDFGAFVEILPGVEGLVHISELAQHHVENPREIVSQGDQVNVRILEVDAERRRLSLSLKRVEDNMPVQPLPGEEAEPPALGLSDEVFADEVPAAEALEAPATEEEPVAEAEAEVVEDEPAAAEPEAPAEEPVAEAEPEVEAAEEPAAEAEAPEADASDEAAPA
jgi:small subunit ribosomal protein S1